MTPLKIIPGIGIGPFKLGMTREEAWAQTRCGISSFYAQEWATERSDDFTALGIHAHYESGRVTRLVAFTRTPHFGQNVLQLHDENMTWEFRRADVVALLDLHELAHIEREDQVVAGGLGLTFGFQERGDGEERLDYVLVEVIGGKAP